jgi:type II secretory pathway pseudopilin PulG
MPGATISNGMGSGQDRLAAGFRVQGFDEAIGLPDGEATGQAPGFGGSSMARRLRKSGFTLVEALLAITFAALAASTLILGTFAAVQTTSEAEDQTIAEGMAQQLMDEIMGYPYIQPGGDPYATPIGAPAAQTGVKSRAGFASIGDFNGYRAQPPCDPWGIALGADDGAGGTRAANLQAPTNRFANWRQEIDVYYVNENDLAARLPGSNPSYLRAVEVRINWINPSNGTIRTLTQLRRVIAYVPPLP